MNAADEFANAFSCPIHGWLQPCRSCAAIQRNADADMGNRFGLGAILSGVQVRLARRLRAHGIRRKPLLAAR